MSRNGRKKKRHGFFEIAEIWQDYSRNKALKERNRIEKEKLARQNEREQKRIQSKREEEKRRAERNREAQRRRAEQERKEKRKRAEAERLAEEARRRELEREAIARDKARLQDALRYCERLRRDASVRSIIESVAAMRDSLRSADGRQLLDMPSLQICSAAESLRSDVRDRAVGIKDCRGAGPVLNEFKKLQTLTSRFEELVDGVRQYNAAVQYLDSDFAELKHAIGAVRKEFRDPDHGVISAREARDRFSSHITVIKEHSRSARLHLKTIRAMQRLSPGLSRLKGRAEEVVQATEPILLAYDQRHWFKQLFHSSLTAYAFIGIAVLSAVLGLLTRTWILLVIALILSVPGGYATFNLLVAYRVSRRSE